MSRKSRRGKRDNNHQEIFAVMRPIASVCDLADAGDGIPDGSVKPKGHVGWQWFDVKNPETPYGRSGLNPIQMDWAMKTGGPVYLISSVDEAMQLARGDLDGLNRFPPENGKISAGDLLALKKMGRPKGRPISEKTTTDQRTTKGQLRTT
ncbi:hypothetical protein [Thalassobius sp. Cn5-15]|uniref:hypothetical protein n=1 Tax=Thalassobius sp. Cn5-15 TaxID=2917763 RepID=UPI001EF32D91|nr:hypothetical protein [Thalassobius sp. Cn5-15]MCG7492449.1 hypothetical protein [Thalassobius sp. Cn5-15]